MQKSLTEEYYENERRINTLKEEIETLSRKLAELNEEELAQVTGGGPEFSIPVKADGVVKASGTIDGQACVGTSDLVIEIERINHVTVTE